MSASQKITARRERLFRIISTKAIIVWLVVRRFELRVNHNIISREEGEGNQYKSPIVMLLVVERSLLPVDFSLSVKREI